MADYQLTASEEPCAVIREKDGACIPPDMANRDYAEYLEWKDEGNEPDPYVEPEVTEPETAAIGGVAEERERLYHEGAEREGRTP